MEVLNFFSFYIEDWHQLLAVSLIPVLITIILHFINVKYLDKMKFWPKQIIFGVVFGLVSIAGTEFGVDIGGFLMNVRDAAPLCAGLFFGWPAGIIAGLIGGIERWFSVFWTGAYLTRIACTLGTIISGLLAAFLNKFIFRDKEINPAHAFTIGVVAETIHMFLVLLTNTSSTEAFNVVEQCTIPMVTCVAIAVFLSSFAVKHLNKYVFKKEEEKLHDMSFVFQMGLLIVITISFFLTYFFCVSLQSDLSNAQTKSLLDLNVSDAKYEINETMESHLLDKLETIRSNVISNNTYSSDYLKTLVDKYDVVEINLIGVDEIIYASSNDAYIGFDMESTSQSREFSEMFQYKNIDYYIQEYRAQGYDSSDYRKYAAYRLSRGYIQVAFDINQLYEDDEEIITLLANNRRVGKTGGLIIASTSGTVISDYSQYYTGKKLSDIGLQSILKEDNIGVKYQGIIDYQDCYYEFDIIGNYIIIAYEPVEEAIFSAKVALYTTLYLEVIIYFGIFVVIYAMLDRSIVRNIKRINHDLTKITNGDLNVNVRSNNTIEFVELSSHINNTVDKLKQLINDAENRVKKELEYAAQIQNSSLPKNFPILDEFEIYASMNPAKEVGGDFYDFFFISEHEVVILIADVSGKGIPAALFMMRAKSTIRSYAESGMSVNEILGAANNNLVEGNDAELFVTAWIGILDIDTGHLNYANAGHNPPLIRNNNEEFKYLKSAAGFVLGGLENVKYKKFELDLSEGSTLFIYTDGAPEAQNKDNELFGEDRLIESVKRNQELSCEDICKNVEHEIMSYQGEDNQFDDLTLLCLKFKKKRSLY